MQITLNEMKTESSFVLASHTIGIPSSQLPKVTYFGTTHNFHKLTKIIHNPRKKKK